ncbi:TonB-dependent receptor [Dasania marina]|uniref:TonB-dependent receptor n=1 Tax=Dasania marina TaxID=471499 RepID=UPI00037A32AD|nr:TonB-dependent receptor [Dasania marina]
MLLQKSYLLAPLILSQIAYAAPLEEIIVTAQKRPIAMHKLGVSMQAITGDQLVEQRISNASDVFKQLSNVSLNEVNPVNSGFTLRGVGTNNFHGNVNRAVAIYQDDIIAANPYTGVISLFDMARVEVLRGPQNTVFGRNAIGGVVNYISAKPTTNGAASTGYLNATVGEYGLFSSQGALGFAINDNNAARLAFFSSQRDGLFRNQAAGREGEELGGSDKHAWRAQWLHELSPATSILLNWHGSRLQGLGMGNKAIGLRDPNDPSSPCADAAQHDFEDSANCVTASGSNPSTDDWHTLYDVSPAEQDIAIQGGFIKLVHSWPELELTSISAFDNTDVSFSEDLAGDISLRMVAFQDSEFEQISQELRLATSHEQALQWMAGLNYFKEDMLQATNVRRVIIANNAPITAYNILDQENEEYTVFTQLDYAINSQTTWHGGLRYSHDEKTADSHFGLVLTPEALYPADTFINQALVQQLSGNNPAACQPGQVPCAFNLDQLSQRLEEVGGNISIDHQCNDQVLLYSSYGRGYKSGGFDTRALAAFAGTADKPVEPEYLDALELGFKTRSNDRQLSINGALFYYQWQDLQTFDVVNGAPGFVNIPQSDIYGLELETTWQAPAQWLLQGSVGWLHSEIKDSGDLSNIDEGHELQNTPEFSFSGAVSKSLNSQQGIWFFKADARYVSSQIDSLRFSDDAFSKRERQWYVNAATSFSPHHTGLTLTLWADNLTEEKTCLQKSSLDNPLTTSATDLSSTLTCGPSLGQRLVGLSINYQH